jgi:hypothetical protein
MHVGRYVSLICIVENCCVICFALVGACDMRRKEGEIMGTLDEITTITSGRVCNMAKTWIGMFSKAAHLLASIGILQNVEICNAYVTLLNPLVGFWIIVATCRGKYEHCFHLLESCITTKN